MSGFGYCLQKSSKLLSWSAGCLAAALIAGPGQVSAEHLAVVSGQEARKENFQVSSRINWHRDLDSARAEAAKSGKLVFWMHMLGSVDGKT